eukprot:17590-Chlamydomonas_euryale.AAC.6
MRGDELKGIGGRESGWKACAGLSFGRHRPHHHSVICVGEFEFEAESRSVLTGTTKARRRESKAALGCYLHRHGR